MKRVKRVKLHENMRKGRSESDKYAAMLINKVVDINNDSFKQTLIYQSEPSVRYSQGPNQRTLSC